MLNIAYITSRLNPKIEWFFDSLHLQCEGNYDDIRIIVVDFWAEQPGRLAKIQSLAHTPIVHTAPKPTVWQGRYRLTKQDYFAASNARNTALMLAQDGHIAYVDDLSVLLPGWLDSVKWAYERNLIVFGTYEKVFKLRVFKGAVMDYDERREGKDPRALALAIIGKPGCQPCTGNNLFGCSLTGPVEAFLKINGWDEDCDSMGAEDYACGIMLESSGQKCHINSNMRTIEAEELHHTKQLVMKRIDKQNIKSHKDASHAYLYMIQHGGRVIAPNYFGKGGLRAVRDRVLAGEPLPVCQIPEHDWRDGQPLSEM